MGLNHQGSGLYTLAKKRNKYAPNGGSKLERFHLELKNEVIQEINAFTATNNYNYKITFIN